MTTRRTLGSLLHPADRAEVLQTYTSRFTMEHVPFWATVQRRDGTYYAPHYRTDADWLSCTTFAVRKDGRLHQGRTGAEDFACRPLHVEYFPLGKSLAAPYRKA